MVRTEEIDGVKVKLSDPMLWRLVDAYVERLDGDTGPMSTEAWFLCSDNPVTMALERRGLTEKRTFDSEGFPSEEWRLLSDWGVKVAAYLVEKYEITWDPK